VIPVKKNLNEYGIQKKVDALLLNQMELDFRMTMKEIVKDYPSTKGQKAENSLSVKNHGVYNP
jgi:hypothetical protein